ncbi:hypothetical protein T439DRAFT_371354 [Meredithblackwellia eburnea MCA 4105]
MKFFICEFFFLFLSLSLSLSFSPFQFGAAELMFDQNLPCSLVLKLCTYQCHFGSCLENPSLSSILRERLEVCNQLVNRLLFGFTDEFLAKFRLSTDSCNSQRKEVRYGIFSEVRKGLLSNSNLCKVFQEKFSMGGSVVCPLQAFPGGTPLPPAHHLRSPPHMWKLNQPPPLANTSTQERGYYVFNGLVAMIGTYDKALNVSSTGQRTIHVSLECVGLVQWLTFGILCEISYSLFVCIYHPAVKSSSHPTLDQLSKFNDNTSRFHCNSSICFDGIAFSNTHYLSTFKTVSKHLGLGILVRGVLLEVFNWQASHWTETGDVFYGPTALAPIQTFIPEFKTCLNFSLVVVVLSTTTIACLPMSTSNMDLKKQKKLLFVSFINSIFWSTSAFVLFLSGCCPVAICSSKKWSLGAWAHLLLFVLDLTLALIVTCHHLVSIPVSFVNDICSDCAPAFEPNRLPCHGYWTQTRGRGTPIPARTKVATRTTMVGLFFSLFCFWMGGREMSQEYMERENKKGGEVYFHLLVSLALGVRWGCIASIARVGKGALDNREGSWSPREGVQGRRADFADQVDEFVSRSYPSSPLRELPVTVVGFPTVALAINQVRKEFWVCWWAAAKGEKGPSAIEIEEGTSFVVVFSQNTIKAAFLVKRVSSLQGQQPHCRPGGATPTPFHLPPSLYHLSWRIQALVLGAWENFKGNKEKGIHMGPKGREKLRLDSWGTNTIAIITDRECGFKVCWKDKKVSWVTTLNIHNGSKISYAKRASLNVFTSSFEDVKHLDPQLACKTTRKRVEVEEDKDHKLVIKIAKQINVHFLPSYHTTAALKDVTRTLGLHSVKEWLVGSCKGVSAGVVGLPGPGLLEYVMKALMDKLRSKSSWFEGFELVEPKNGPPRASKTKTRLNKRQCFFLSNCDECGLRSLVQIRPGVQGWNQEGELEDIQIAHIQIQSRLFIFHLRNLDYTYSTPLSCHLLSHLLGLNLKLLPLHQTARSALCWQAARDMLRATFTELSFHRALHKLLPNLLSLWIRVWTIIVQLSPKCGFVPTLKSKLTVSPFPFSFLKKFVHSSSLLSSLPPPSNSYSQTPTSSPTTTYAVAYFPLPPPEITGIVKHPQTQALLYQVLTLEAKLSMSPGPLLIETWFIPGKIILLETTLETHSMSPPSAHCSVMLDQATLLVRNNCPNFSPYCSFMQLGYCAKASLKMLIHHCFISITNTLLTHSHSNSNLMYQELLRSKDIKVVSLLQVKAPVQPIQLGEFKLPLLPQVTTSTNSSTQTSSSTLFNSNMLSRKPRSCLPSLSCQLALPAPASQLALPAPPPPKSINPCLLNLHHKEVPPREGAIVACDLIQPRAEANGTFAPRHIFSGLPNILSGFHTKFYLFCFNYFI